MSFEGYEEVICANGHYDTADVYSDSKLLNNKCALCGANFHWFNLVDTTNGMQEPDDPGSWPALKEVVAKIPRTPDYLSEYIVKPAGERWKPTKFYLSDPKNWIGREVYVQHEPYPNMQPDITFAYKVITVTEAGMWVGCDFGLGAMLVRFDTFDKIQEARTGRIAINVIGKY